MNMRTRQFLATLCLVLASSLLCVSCEKEIIVGQEVRSSNGQYVATLVHCTGNTTEQELSVVLMITNTEFNAEAWVGGYGGTVAIDGRGNTLTPYHSAGYFHDFPTGVAVRVTIERLGKIMPGTMMLQSLTVSIGSSGNVVEFRNVPIVWN